MTSSAGADERRLTTLLGIEHPVVQGPLGGGLSSVALAAAVSNAGGLGSFGAHHLAPDAITALVTDLRAATAKPFAVNLWVPQPTEGRPADLAPHRERLVPFYRRLGLGDPPGDDQLRFPSFPDQVEALLDAAPPIISFVMGIPPREVLDTAKEKNILTIGTATTVDEAEALEAAGLDVVVASGSDAGGHRGAFLRPVEHSLVGTFSLVPQVVDRTTIPVVAAGGIADRRGVRAALALGAHGVQVGTGFLATRESNAGAVHKRMLHTDAARVTVLTKVFSGRTARGIHNALIAELGNAEVAPYPFQNALMQPLRTAAAERGLADYVSLWAGQAAPLTNTENAGTKSAADYFAELVQP
uniref:NAD(P)H-dependent flavin oxidoreductase n=1 Tax=Saccharothrix mutabilis TaxID=33921 RepID=UPI0031DC5AEE